MPRRILITGAGSGLGEAAAIGIARDGHEVIATAQTWSQVTALRAKAKTIAQPTLHVEKLDLLDPYDVARACKWDFDILVNNAGIGEGVPITEIPLEIVRHNFEVNVFAQLALTQRVVKSWSRLGFKGKSSSSRQWAASSVHQDFPLTPRRNMRSRRLRRRCRLS